MKVTKPRGEKKKQYMVHANNVIYDLSLHEETETISNSLGKIVITRVPGGWLYSFPTINMPSVLVPFNNEFLKGYYENN